MKILPGYWKGYLILVVILVVSLLAAACGGGEEEKPTIKFTDTQFESGWINNAIAQFVIEHGYGYPVESVVMTTVVAWVTLPKGEVHINMELWQQNLIEIYNEVIANGTVENLGMTYEGGPQFFIIPTWVHEQYNINTVDDMKAHWALFKDPEDTGKGAFINCIIGWQCGEINTVKLEAYGLTDFYNIISPGSVAAMDAGLTGPQKKNEPVFGYYWAPTSIMGAYDWYILEEPAYDPAVWDKITAAREDRSLRPIAEAVAYETLPIDKGIWSGLRDMAPDVVAMLEKMNVGLEPLNKTAAWAVQTDIEGNWERAALYYLENYEVRWKTWMPDENYKKVKAAVNSALGFVP